MSASYSGSRIPGGFDGGGGGGILAATLFFEAVVFVAVALAFDPSAGIGSLFAVFCFGGITVVVVVVNKEQDRVCATVSTETS